MVATVKALACELPAQLDAPLSRASTADLVRLISAHPDAPAMSRNTIRRLLDRDALKPWQHQSWLCPRDPQFAAKAGRILDLYQGVWAGQPLAPDDCVLSADEKTSIQARVRCQATTPLRPGQAMRVEHEYARGGALAYLAAWDVRRGGIVGRCEPTTGIAPFDRLVEQVMQQEPYRSARRVFWIVDNGSSHRGATATARLQGRYPTLILVHLPIHASWLNQIALYFSIVQRKVLTPNDFPNREAVEQAVARLRSAVQRHRRALPLAFHPPATGRPPRGPPGPAATPRDARSAGADRRLTLQLFVNPSTKSVRLRRTVARRRGLWKCVATQLGPSATLWILRLNYRRFQNPLSCQRFATDVHRVA